MDRRRALALALIEFDRESNRQENISVWVHDILKERKRHGEYHHLVQELRLDDGRFKAYFRMSRQDFDNLLSIVGPTITKQDTNYRDSIGPAERLSICIRYLATGDSYRSIAFSYRVGFSTVVDIVPEVCEALWSCLVQDYMPFPKGEKWRAIAEDFAMICGFPNCVVAIDGKHVVIQAPANSGSIYYNYKGSYSIVLLAMVDARYRFLMVDVGAYGKTSNGGTLSLSAFGRALRNNTLGLPSDKPLPGTDRAMPYVFVADEAFPLCANMSGSIWPQNKGSSINACPQPEIVECAFGILGSQWRVYRRSLGVSPETAEKVVKATCILHNYIRGHSEEEDPSTLSFMPPESSPGMQCVGQVGSNRASHHISPPLLAEQAGRMSRTKVKSVILYIPYIVYV
ncbi:hypothetical protein ACEWY4_005882 [Coilia grayii]|uniref:DDE Tnp4 domain-containing protein n=1 Tax=Coilia grayii TaxID=363190 RepID=A0ABD1KJW0_9TELE